MRYLALALGVASAFAQTATITAPAASATINGDKGAWQYTLQSTCVSCTAVYQAAYYVDGELVGITRSAPYSYAWPPYYAGNNAAHSVYVVYSNALNAVIATSPAVTFAVANNLPQMACATTCDSISVTPQLVAEFLGLGSPNYSFNVISFYASSGTPAIVNGTTCAIANGGSTQTLSCAGAGAGHTIAVYTRWQSATATLTCSASSGTLAYGSVGQSSSLSGQWCYAYNIASGTFAMRLSNSSSATFVQSFAFEISGTVTSNPIDVNIASTQTASAAVDSTPFSLAHSATNEILFAGATWNSGTTPTAGPGWKSLYAPAGSGSAVEAINPPAGASFGTENLRITANGADSGVSKSFNIFVDGWDIQKTAASTSTTANVIINTTQFLNAAHQVVVRADGTGAGCLTCVTNAWTDMGGWEQTQTFSNLVVPSQLLMSAREVMLTAGGSAVTMTGTDLNTDGSSTAATLKSCVPNSTTFFTISGTCTITPASTAGIDFVTATDSNGFTRVFWPFVLTSGQNTIPNFGSDGQIHSGYYSGSIWRASAFSTVGVNPLPTGVTSAVNRPARYDPGWAQAGFTTIETGLEIQTATQAEFDTQINNDTAFYASTFASYGQGRLKWVHLIGDSWFRTTPGMFATMYGPSACNPTCGPGWSSPALPDVVQRWVSSRIIQGLQGVDEVGLSWGGNPLEGTNTGGIIIGTNGFSQLSASGGTCTVAWPAPNNDRFTGAHSFIITGSGTNLDYVESTNSPIFTFSSLISTGFTFPCGYTGAAITSGTLQLQTYFYQAFDASGNACSPVSGQLGGGYSSGPCTRWNQYNIFSQIRTWLTSVTNFIPMDWPLAASCCTYGIANWSGANKVAGVRAGDYWVAYDGAEFIVKYLPGASSMSSQITLQGDTLRNTLAYMDRTTPLIAETNGNMQNYLFQGYPVAITSCAGNIITTATPHGLHNVIPEMTKLWVTGSSGCNGNYKVLALPTANTIAVGQANASFAISSPDIGGSIYFQNTVGGADVAGPFPISAMYSSAGGFTVGNSPGAFNISSVCPNSLNNNRGLYFTVAGSSNSNVNAMTAWFDNAYSVNACGQTEYWLQVPDLSSTGGTAYLVPDLWYRPGISWKTDSDSGPRNMFATVNESAIEGASGIRSYTATDDPQYSDLTLTGVNASMSGAVLGNSQVFNGIVFGSGVGSAQVGPNPIVDFGRSHETVMSHANPNLLHARLAKYEYQPRLNSPDFGRQFEAAARSGSYGNLLMIQSYVDAATPCTANLAPYLIPGQPIIRFSMTWDSIQAVDVLPAGTTTDSKTCGPGEFRAYVFSVNESAELEQPAVLARLADVANATQIIVQYSYTPLSFTSPSVASQTQYQTFSCGTGTCNPPWDRNIGPIYYRLVYLDSSGRILTPNGAIETL